MLKVLNIVFFTCLSNSREVKAKQKNRCFTHCFWDKRLVVILTSKVSDNMRCKKAFSFYQATCAKRQCYQSNKKSSANVKIGNNGHFSLLNLKPRNGQWRIVHNYQFIRLKLGLKLIHWIYRSMTPRKNKNHPNSCHTWQHKANCYEYLMLDGNWCDSEMNG